MGAKSRATADGEGEEEGGGLIGGRRLNAPRLLSDTVNGCYKSAFMSVGPSSTVLNTDVAHSLSRADGLIAS